MDGLFSAIGLIGAACAVFMYTVVSLGKISADRPIFYGVNAVGAILVLMAAAREFDFGDMGTIAQEFVWAVMSFWGLYRTSRQGASLDAYVAPQMVLAAGPRQSFGLKPRG